MGTNIDAGEAEAELEKAKGKLTQFEGQKNSTDKVKAQEKFNKARAWFQASKSN